MAYNSRTTRSANALSLGEWLNVLRADLNERWARYQKYRATIEELEALSDRDLADLSIHRSCIRDIASEHAYGH